MHRIHWETFMYYTANNKQQLQNYKPLLRRRRPVVITVRRAGERCRTRATLHVDSSMKLQSDPMSTTSRRPEIEGVTKKSTAWRSLVPPWVQRRRYFGPRDVHLHRSECGEGWFQVVIRAAEVIKTIEGQPMGRRRLVVKTGQRRWARSNWFGDGIARRPIRRLVGIFGAARVLHHNYYSN